MTHPSDRVDKLPVAVDLDGTLLAALWTPENRTREFGGLLPDVFRRLDELIDQGYDLVVHTSRPGEDLPAIVAQLDRAGLMPYFVDIITDKFLAELYVDDKARHAGEESWLP